MKKVLIIAAAVIAAAGIVFLLLGRSASKPITKRQAVREIQILLEKEIAKNKNVNGGLVLVDSKAFGVRETFAAGTEDGKPLEPDRPFHIASIGKSFTAALVGILLENKLLSLNDPIAEYLPADILAGLFVFEGKDYSGEVTVKQLLNHTSGVADYFGDPVTSGRPLKALIIEEPDRFWRPLDLLAFSRELQKSVSKPGEKFHYSDTGYILLGLIVEKISGRSFHELMHDKIFSPLGMNDSYVMFYSQSSNNPRPIAEILLEGTDISGFTSLSIDWAGGGIISTLNDLELFVRALNGGDVVEEETLHALYNFDQKYMNGIHYGLGFMEFHFGEYFPLLKAYPKLKGHMGILGTQMLYDKETETVYIASFGSTDYSAGSVRTMIKILGLIMRIREQPYT